MAKPKTAPAKNFSEEIVEIFGGMVRGPARMLFQKSELPSVEYNVGVAGRDCEHQKQKTDGRKNQSGDGGSAACVKSRPLADLRQRDAGTFEEVKAIRVTCGDCASFQTSACSRPPEPMTKIFMRAN